MMIFCLGHLFYVLWMDVFGVDHSAVIPEEPKSAAVKRIVIKVLPFVFSSTLSCCGCDQLLYNMPMQASYHWLT